MTARPGDTVYFNCKCLAFIGLLYLGVSLWRDLEYDERWYTGESILGRCSPGACHGWARSVATIPLGITPFRKQPEMRQEAFTLLPPAICKPRLSVLSSYPLLFIPLFGSRVASQILPATGGQ